jgi:Bardet-Biedl syndrome 4 protein
MESDEIISSNNNETLLKSEKKMTISETSVNQKDSVNWLLYDLFIRKEYDECLNLLNKLSKEHDSSKMESEYALHIRALIKRHRGEINESSELLKKCFSFNSSNTDVMKEIGKNVVLNGNFRRGIEIYDEIINYDNQDWDAFNEKGFCFMELKDFDSALACFNCALEISRNEKSLTLLAKLAILQEDYGRAIERLQEATNFASDDPELLTQIGALCLKVGNTEDAYDNFCKAMRNDSSFSNALMGVASIHQDKFEYEQALISYKLASTSDPNSPLVWNNLGLCFFAKQKYIAAVTCLKKANYLDPFEWIISFNLGLVYLQQKQYASAFNFMNCAANLRSDFYLIYFFLGIILAKLGDIHNAIPFYEKSLELNPNYLTYYNYTVSLLQNDMIENAKEKFKKFYGLYQSNRDASLEYDQDIIEAITVLQKSLFG